MSDAETFSSDVESFFKDSRQDIDLQACRC